MRWKSVRGRREDYAEHTQYEEGEQGKIDGGGSRKIGYWWVTHSGEGMREGGARGSYASQGDGRVGGEMEGMKTQDGYASQARAR